MKRINYRLTPDDMITGDAIMHELKSVRENFDEITEIGVIGLTGEQGIEGPQGPQGESGVAGIDYLGD